LVTIRSINGRQNDGSDEEASNSDEENQSQK
jgi:hypothetical protein